MSWIRRFFSSDSYFLQFSITKKHFVVSVFGVLFMLVASFGLGFVVAERRAQADNNAFLVASSISGSSAVETTVKIAPRNDSKGKTAKASDSPTIQPTFYGSLLGTSKPEAENLPPLELPISPTPGSSSENKPKDLKPKPQQPASKPTLPARPKKNTLKLSTTPRFTIQVATVKKPANAIRIHQSLRDKGHAVFIKPVALKGKGGWFRVYIGRFIDKNAATRALRELHVKTAMQGGQIVPL
jgi:cell division septation protein DedD